LMLARGTRVINGISGPDCAAYTREGQRALAVATLNARITGSTLVRPGARTV
jgi:hypothetical protein